MTKENPYQAPKSDVTDQSMLDKEKSDRMKKMAKGQKMVIYSVVINLLSMFLLASLGLLGLVISIASLVISFVGVFLVLSADKINVIYKVIVFILLFVPLFNLLVLLRLNGRATKALKESGYKVGFLGASKID